MLCITMKRGEYFTVDGKTVILFDQLSGERAHLTIHAPREVAIVRGEVLERQGGERPACLAALPAKKKRRSKPGTAFLWNDERESAVKKLEALSAKLEASGAAEEAAALRAQLHRLMPSPWEDELTTKLLSTGSQPAEI